MEISLEGMDELDAAIQAAVKALSPDVVEPILQKGAETIADEARSRAPVGPTGNLRRSIVGKGLKRRMNILGVRTDMPASALAAINYRRGPHAHLLEFGTVKMSARPFFGPAVAARLNEVKQQIAEDIQTAVKEGWNK